MSTTSFRAPASFIGQPFTFDNTYARLPSSFFRRVAPAKVASPQLIRLNDQLALRLGGDSQFLRSASGLAFLSGNEIAPGSEPIALAYAGHQFGNFVPQLGDGRAVLIGEVVGRDGNRVDIQLKGSGRTPFSRGGDGRAAIGPVLREYIVSEAMAALGIPTTRSLAAVSTGEQVARERMLPGAILTRVASSHLRVGTFQYFAVRGDIESVRLLSDYAIDRHYPDTRTFSIPYRAFLDRVIQRIAELTASWMNVGFIHGVLNTDNVSIAGETLDYGPCAFLDVYDPNKVFSSIDRIGRYAYSNQPGIMKWNLARLAETLLPLLSDSMERAIEMAYESLALFDSHYEKAYLAGIRRKLGFGRELEGDAQLGAELLLWMSESRADFTLTFRDFRRLIDTNEMENRVARQDGLEAWLPRWRERLRKEERAPGDIREDLNAANPAFIPRNHQIEAAIRQAEDGEYHLFNTLVDVLARPFDGQPEFAHLSRAPAPSEEVKWTFCGT